MSLETSQDKIQQSSIERMAGAAFMNHGNTEAEKTTNNAIKETRNNKNSNDLKVKGKMKRGEKKTEIGGYHGTPPIAQQELITAKTGVFSAPLV